MRIAYRQYNHRCIFDAKGLSVRRWDNDLTRGYPVPMACARRKPSPNG